jgi:hypothetical protein
LILLGGTSLWLAGPAVSSLGKGRLRMKAWMNGSSGLYSKRASSKEQEKEQTTPFQPKIG